MKKILSIILSVVLAFGMVACGGGTANPGGAADTAGTETPADNTVTEDKKADDGTFDTSWASNDYEALIPQLPFSGWTTKQDGDTYKMELGGLKTETLTDADGKTIGYGEDKAALIEYIDGLAAYGFRVEETGDIPGYVYEWEIEDRYGNDIEITCAEGWCWVEIEKD